MMNFDLLFDTIPESLAQDIKFCDDWYTERYDRLKKDSAFLLNYSHHLLKVGESWKAMMLLESIVDPDSNIKSSIDLKIVACSNYMMACDYCGIHLKNRVDITQYFPKSEKKYIYTNNSKIVIAYISGDMYNHPVGRIFEKIIKNHDRDRFEINLYCSSLKDDDISKSILSNCDRVFYIGKAGDKAAISSKQVYDVIRSFNTEVLVDLSGHTDGGTRLPIFCKYPCNLQISMLGYPNETPLDCFDLRMGSDIVQYDKPFFNNPHGYLPLFNTMNQIGMNQISKGYIIIGVISTLAKITQSDIQWYDLLLAKYPHTRLLYARCHPVEKQYIKRVADSIMSMHSEQNRNRITIINTHEPYAKLYEKCDVVLDNANWNLHATMYDALSCGVPVISRKDVASKLQSNKLSIDVYNSTGLTKHNMNTSILQSEPRVMKESSLLYKHMQSFDNSNQWAQAYEQCIIDRVQFDREVYLTNKQKGWQK